MKKTFIAAAMLFALGKPVFASDKIKLGLKVAPAISFGNVKDKKEDGIDFSSNGSGFRFIAGPFADFAINENVYIGTGLWYSPRTVKLKSEISFLGITESSSSQYNLQYLMIPLYVKFYTNEITTGVRLYFNLGGTFDIKIAEKDVNNEKEGIKAAADSLNKALFSYVDASILLGAGVEINLSDVTNIFIGINYNRGLTNIVNPTLTLEGATADGMKLYQHVAIKNNLISLDLGLKF